MGKSEENLWSEVDTGPLESVLCEMHFNKPSVGQVVTIVAALYSSRTCLSVTFYCSPIVASTIQENTTEG